MQSGAVRKTAERTYLMDKGDKPLVVPAGVAMRLVASAPTPLRASAVIVYDASVVQVIANDVSAAD